MKNYEKYRVEDFIQDDDFRDWVQGHSNRESFWLSFLHQYPEQRDALQRAERFIGATTVSEERLSELEIRKEADQFIERAGAYIPDRHKSLHEFQYKKGEFGANNAVRWGMATVALLTVVLGVA